MEKHNFSHIEIKNVFFVGCVKLPFTKLAIYHMLFKIRGVKFKKYNIFLLL